MKHRRLLQIGLLGAFVLTAVTAHAGWSFKRTGGRQAAALQFATIESWITIKTDMGTPITGDVTMIDEAGKSLWLDDNGDSGELTLSRSGKRFTFQDQVLDNGNLLLGSTVAWQPSPTTDFEELTIGLPEAEYTLFDSVAPGSYQPPPFSEYWSWSGWGPKWSFDPFEARVTLLNTQASQRSVRRGKG